MNAQMVIENQPTPEDVRLLEDRIYEFNVQATGIADGELLAVLLKSADGSTVGGAYGWTWGATGYIRYLFVPETLRKQGYGSRLLDAFEADAKMRGCRQIVLETHDFQAPRFYERFGFKIVSRIDDYPRGYQYLTMIKSLPA